MRAPRRSLLACLIGGLLLLGGGSAAQQDTPEESGRLERMLEQAERERDPDRLYQVLMDLGLAYSGMGEYEQAEESFRRALETRERRFGLDDPGAGDALMHVALMVSNQRRIEEAGLLFDRAEPIIAASGNPFDYPRYISYLAIHGGNAGRFQEAFELAQDATARRRGLVKEQASRRRAGLGGSMTTGLLELAQSLYVESALAYRLENPETARVTAELARKIVTDTEQAPRWWLAQIDELLALIEIDSGEFAAAESRMRRALATKRRSFGDTRPSGLAFLSLGAVHQAQGELDPAVGRSREGVGIIERGLESGRGVSADRVSAFLMAADQKGRTDPGERQALIAEMFAVSQLTQTGVTAQAIAQTAARLAADDPALQAQIRAVQDAARRRDSLRLEFGQEAALPNDRRDRARLERISASFKAAAEEADRLEAALNTAHPDYADLVAPRPVSAARVVEMLAPDEALMTVLVGARRTFLIVVRGDGRLEAAPTDLTRRDIEDGVTHLREAFEVRGGRIQEFDLNRAHALYTGLFKPVEPALEGVSHLVMVATGALLSLPPSLLVSEPPTPGDYAGAAWLARNLATTMAPSVPAFANLRGLGQPSRAPRPFIGFANATFTGQRGGLQAAMDSCRNGAPMPAETLRSLEPLPGTEDEVRTIARELGAGTESLFLRAGMTEPAVRRAPLNQYRVVYFATHGLLPGELLCQAEPALALSPPARTPPSRDRDGLLEGSEIAALRLDADLVVLSACNTGASSGEFGGEALSGMARSFFLAGARSLMVSHWVVDSAATVSLMTDLFGQWTPGGTARALRQAQLRMLDDPNRSHPFFWAPFTVVGSS